MIARLREQLAKAVLETDAARNRDHDRQAELEAMAPWRISEEAQNTVETAIYRIQASRETLLETQKQRRDLQRQLVRAKSIERIKTLLGRSMEIESKSSESSSRLLMSNSTAAKTSVNSNWNSWKR